jgi:cytochrome c
MRRRVSAFIVSMVVVTFSAAVVLAFTTQQATQGKELYVKHCAVCHSPDGHGGKVPAQFGSYAGQEAAALVGSGALPGMADAGQVYDFAKTKMPLNKPASLKDSEYLDVVAFALEANGIKADGKPLTPESAKAVKLGGASK